MKTKLLCKITHINTAYAQSTPQTLQKNYSYIIQTLSKGNGNITGKFYLYSCRDFSTASNLVSHSLALAIASLRTDSFLDFFPSFLPFFLSINQTYPSSYPYMFHHNIVSHLHVILTWSHSENLIYTVLVSIDIIWYNLSTQFM